MLWTSKFVRSLAIVVVSPSIWLVALTESWATERSVPAYRFAVGQELAYGEENQSLGMPGDPPDQPRNKTSGEWQIWVVGKNSDGSWRLLLRHKYLVVSIKPKQQPVERLSNCMLAHCDIFPDGRVPKNSTLGDSYYFQINPNWLFVALPRDQKAMTTGWSQVPVIGEWSRRCSIDSGRAGSARSLVINCIEHDPSQAAYAETKTRRCTFDLDAGRLSEMVEDDTASAGKFPWHARTTLKLKSASQKPADWVAQFDREAMEFFAARTKYEHLFQDFNRTRAVDAFIAQSNRARILEGSPNVRKVGHPPGTVSGPHQGARSCREAELAIGEGPGRCVFTPRSGLGAENDRRFEASAGGRPRQSCDPRFLVPRMLLVHQGHSTNRAGRGPLSRDARRRAGNEHRPGGEGRPIRHSPNGSEIPTAESRAGGFSLSCQRPGQSGLVHSRSERPRPRHPGRIPRRPREAHRRRG